MILKLVPKHTFFFCILPLLVAASTTYAQKSSPPHLSDPYADPANDPYNPLRYIASDTLTGISFSEF